MMDDKQESVNAIRQQIKEVLEEEKHHLSPRIIPLMEEALVKVFEEGASPKEALNLTQDFIDEIYENGYHLFQSGKFKDALSFFNVLRNLDAMDARFTLAIAITFHRMKKYEEAVGNYVLYAALEPKDPLPYYYLYDCFSKLNLPLASARVLEVAHKLAEKDPQYADLNNRVELELANLKSSEGNAQQEQKSSTP